MTPEIRQQSDTSRGRLYSASRGYIGRDEMFATSISTARIFTVDEAIIPELIKRWSYFAIPEGSALGRLEWLTWQPCDTEQESGK